MEGIAVTGRGSVGMQPDLAVLTAGVSVLDRKADSARHKASKAMQDLIQAADTCGILPSDRQTGTLRVAPEYDYNDGIQKLRGYRVTNTITMRSRNLDDLPRLVDALLAAAGDAGVLHGIDFEIEDRRAAEEGAIEAAVADARYQAEVLARAGGLTLGRALSIDARWRDGALPVPRMALMTERSRAPTPVEAGAIDIEVHADVVFAIA